MVPIQTRQNRHGKWWCNCTFGYDISVEGETIDDARLQMSVELLKRGGLGKDFFWEEPKLYPKQEPKPKIYYAILRLDTGMV